MVDRVTKGEVRSKRGKKDLFRQREAGFALLLPLGIPIRRLLRWQEHEGETAFAANAPQL